MTKHRLDKKQYVFCCLGVLEDVRGNLVAGKHIEHKGISGAENACPWGSYALEEVDLFMILNDDELFTFEEIAGVIKDLRETGTTNAPINPIYLKPTFGTEPIGPATDFVRRLSEQDYQDWVAALLSGEYEQGRERLATYRPAP